MWPTSSSASASAAVNLPQKKKKRAQSATPTCSSASSLASTSTSSRTMPPMALPEVHESSPLATKETASHRQEKRRNEVICGIFDLPRTTKFYKDFACELASSFAMHGRMYPGSDHICFYSCLFDREKKLVIPVAEIADIQKPKKMFSSIIKIKTTGSSEAEYTFKLWSNLDRCFDLLVSIRKRFLQRRAGAGTGVGSGAGSTSPEILTLSPSTSPASSLALSSPASSSCSVESQTSTSPMADSSSSTWPPRPTSPPRGARRRTRSDNPRQESTPAAAIEAAIDELPQESPAQSKGSKAMETDHQAERPRASSLARATRSIVHESTLFQVLETEFELSTDEFMQLFILDDAHCGLDAFHRLQGHTDIQLNRWIVAAEEDGLLADKIRAITFRTPVDAPFGPSSSHVDVLQYLKTLEDGTIAIDTSTHVVDIPYGDSFSVEDRWFLQRKPSENVATCTLRMETKVVFYKSTIWRGAIQSRAKSESKKKGDDWVQFARDFLLRSRPSLCHDQPGPRPLQGHHSQTNETDKATQTLGPPHTRRSVAGASKRPRGHQNTDFVKLLLCFLILAFLAVIVRLQQSLSRLETMLVAQNERLVQLQSTVDHFTASCGAS